MRTFISFFLRVWCVVCRVYSNPWGNHAQQYVRTHVQSFMYTLETVASTFQNL